MSVNVCRWEATEWKHNELIVLNEQPSFAIISNSHSQRVWPASKWTYNGKQKSRCGKNRFDCKLTPKRAAASPSSAGLVQFL